MPYSWIAAFKLPSAAKGFKSCEMTMERGCVHACHAGALVHGLEGWDFHEVVSQYRPLCCLQLRHESSAPPSCCLQFFLVILTTSRRWGPLTSRESTRRGTQHANMASSWWHQRAGIAHAGPALATVTAPAPPSLPSPTDSALEQTM